MVRSFLGNCEPAKSRSVRPALAEADGTMPSKKINEAIRSKSKKINEATRSNQFFFYWDFMSICYLFHNPIEADSELLGTRWIRGTSNSEVYWGFSEECHRRNPILIGIAGKPSSEESHPNRQYGRSQRKFMKRQGRMKFGRCSGRNNEF